MVAEGDRKSTKYFACLIESNSGRMGTYHRNFMTQTQDKFFRMINDQNANVFSCYYINKYPFEVKDSEVVYRNVKLSNLFPSNRTIGENWSSNVGSAYRTEIETYAKDNGDYDYYETHREYSYILNQESLELVRQYNYQVKDYKNASTIPSSNCKMKIDEESGGEIYYDCKSEFLNNIDNYKIIDNRPDKERGKSDYTVDMENKKNNNP